jgi:uncharacterized protein (TIGR00369 family)
MEIRTHQQIDRNLCGEPVELAEGYCRVRLETKTEMAADRSGLVHGGFLFGLADYAAMLAVNHPNVVLGSASVKFAAPVRAGEVVEAEARVSEAEGKKRLVTVKVLRKEKVVFTGEFVCFVPERHVLDS